MMWTPLYLNSSTQNTRTQLLQKKKKTPFNNLKRPTQEKEQTHKMLTKTTATTSLSLSALSSTTPSRFLCHFSPNTARFFGPNNNLSYTPPNPLSNFVSIGWNTNKNNTNNYRNKSNKCGGSRMESFTTRASAQPLKNAEELIDSVETFIFDCDGEGSCYFSFLNCFLL